jgi:serine phosphatase RsbU (regulator of sigma subunit)
VKTNERRTHWISSRSFDGAPASGDFMELIDLGNGRHGVLAGDIAGRGLGAGGAAKTLHNYSRTLLFQEIPPSDLLRASNEFFARFLSCEKTPFASLFVGYIDCSERTISYASAGHETALLVYQGGKHQHLEYTGALLGLDSAMLARYEESSVPFSSCATLVLVSDGITDARPPDPNGHFFGSSGVLRAFCKDRDCDDPARAIHHAANVHANGELVDDTSVLVARFDGTHSC